MRASSAAASDATPPRSPEEVLRRSEESFRLMVESIRDYAIFILDANGFVTSWNPGAERIKGYKAHEIIGHHFSRFYPEEDVRAGKCEHELETAAKVGRFEDEGWRVRADGTRIWANVVITAIRDPSDGELLGFGKVTRDLTERKQLEEQRLELARVREAVRMRDEFISIASHELRTPLSTLRLQADGMARAVRTLVDPQRLAARIDMIGSQVTRLERLVTSLLDASRIEAGQVKLDPEPLELTQVLDEVLRSLGDELERAGCPVSVSVRARVSGRWDRARIDQVLTNLLTNALKYGGGNPIDVVIDGSDNAATLAVRDRGIGIAREHHARIFERFERAADARHFGGLGLGLWLARQIVEAHGGSITVASELGAGATFTVTLPLEPPSSRPR